MPVLTNRRYDDLEIADGQIASLKFLDMAFGDLKETEKRAIRSALDTYCRQDAGGMPEIVAALRRLCR
jgi:hypothetical protein